MKHVLNTAIFDNFTTRLALSLLLGTSLITMATFRSVFAQNSSDRETVVLVHGAFADGSAWDKVIPLLQAKGLNVVSVQNPLTSLADDVSATKRAISTSPGNVILVGHSWGGTIITQAGTHEKVSALVYVAAFAPSINQTSNDLSKDYPKPEWLAKLRVDSGGFLTLTPDAISMFFAQDLTSGQTSLMAATQGPIFAKSFDEKVTETAWSSKPSFYIVADKDRMISPDLQKVLAKRIGATTTILQTSHVPMLSKPYEVAEVIIAAAGTSKK